MIAQLLGPGNYSRIAEGCGLSRPFVGRVLRGERGASLESAVKIARSAGVRLEELNRYLEKVRMRHIWAETT